MTTTLSDESVRALFPGLARATYLDFAAAGLVSTRVSDAMTAMVALHQQAGTAAGGEWRRHLVDVRAAAAAFVGGDAARLALTQNTTTGLSTVVNGLDWRAGDNVVLPEHEFPSNAFVWTPLRERGVELRKVPAPRGHATVADVLGAVDGRTRAVSVSAVQYSSGYRYPLAELGAGLATTDALFVVDGTQALGALRVDVATAQVDVLAVSAHKWLLGPFGIGFVHFSVGAFEALRPSTVGWLTVEEPFTFTPEPVVARDARRFESGTENMAGAYGLGATIALNQELGLDRIEAAVLENSAFLSGLLVDRGCELISPQSPDEASGIVIARNRSEPNDAVHARLAAHGVRCSARSGGIRFSTHCFTTQEELVRCVDLMVGHP